MLRWKSIFCSLEFLGWIKRLVFFKNLKSQLPLNLHWQHQIMKSWVPPYTFKFLVIVLLNIFLLTRVTNAIPEAEKVYWKFKQGEFLFIYFNNRLSVFQEKIFTLFLFWNQWSKYSTKAIESRGTLIINNLYYLRGTTTFFFFIELRAYSLLNRVENFWEYLKN